MKCFACGDELDMYAKCMGCYDKLGAERGAVASLLAIRERKIELQAKEIELLKKLLALQKPPETKPEDLEPNKYPKESVEIEPSWFVEPPIDRADLETDEYPHYDELTRKE